MKVYFTASIFGKKYHLQNYLQIVNALKSKGYSVIADHILNSSETKIRMETKTERLKFHEKLERWIQSSDCMIVETTFPSISVGYEISLALGLGKPVLILYSQGDPPSLLAHHKDEKLLCERYTSATLRDIIEDFVNFVEAAADARFTFFITPKIASHLEEVSRKEKMPKSVYLRRLIEADILSKK
ncbi:hypothetical protein COT62_02070 [Candidatus Roizmanbacteria bacterium CG09_land_8_20_14_0_10_41_9]|uniref:Nucleoside 2-deoxyribosyltransferase n=1 Tax=Candidatus Roizmanbacteria bacterium CG09_land_8_20_14_0_10_41_9 TaxID=1974850 RepID=A0A2H0WT09_9BACT|nr:MAG: hypothetical protein COT62_02070 [Candidatus Roizmanbacteria bacterium CG09_land_8_20_14_0_10_41_9]